MVFHIDLMRQMLMGMKIRMVFHRGLMSSMTMVMKMEIWMVFHLNLMR